MILWMDSYLYKYLDEKFEIHIEIDSKQPLVPKST